MTRPRPALVVLIVSLMALAVAGIVLARTGAGTAVADIGQRPGAAENAAGGIAAPAANGSPLSDPATGSGGGDPLGRDASSARVDARGLPRPAQPVLPVSIAIPRLDIATPVDVVGLDGAGLVEVPADIRRVGWYRYSAPADASRGSTVLVGHRDGAGQGLGSFAGLGELEPGDVVVVRADDGSRMRYEVVARESFAKDAVPLDELFARSGPRRLTLITCGGPFDATELGYTDNIVVTAVPVALDADSRVDSTAGIRQTYPRGDVR